MSTAVAVVQGASRGLGLQVPRRTSSTYFK